MREYKVFKLPLNRNDVGEMPEQQMENMLNEAAKEGFRVVKITEWCIPDMRAIFPPIIFMERDVIAHA